MESLFDFNSKSSAGTIERLIVNGHSVNVTDKNGRTPLFKAVCLGYFSCADALLRSGANIEHKDNEGNTAFLLAAYSGINTAIDYLIKAGCDVNTKNHAGESAMDVMLSNFMISEDALHRMLTKFSLLDISYNPEAKLPERTQGYLDNWLNAKPAKVE